MDVGSATPNTAKEVFPLEINVPHISEAKINVTSSSLGVNQCLPASSCSEGQPTVQSAKGKNSLSNKQGYLVMRSFSLMQEMLVGQCQE